MKKIAWYPVVFFIVFVPLGAERIAEWYGTKPPEPYIYFALALFAANGFFNMIVYGCTRNVFKIYGQFWNMFKSTRVCCLFMSFLMIFAVQEEFEVSLSDESEETSRVA